MRNSPLLLYGLLPPCNPLENADSALLFIKSLNINKVGCGSTMLGDEHGAAIFLHLGDQARGLALEGGDEFCFHGDTIVALWAFCQSGGEPAGVSP